MDEKTMWVLLFLIMWGSATVLLYLDKAEVRPGTCTVTVEDTGHEQMIFRCEGGKVYQLRIKKED